VFVTGIENLHAPKGSRIVSLAAAKSLVAAGRQLCERVMRDVLGLKINCNACVFADGLPVTLRFATLFGTS
jgi:hypothetical protein